MLFLFAFYVYFKKLINFMKSKNTLFSLKEQGMQGAGGRFGFMCHRMALTGGGETTDDERV